MATISYDPAKQLVLEETQVDQQKSTREPGIKA